MERYELLQLGIKLGQTAMQEPSELNGFHGNANEDMRDLNALCVELFRKEQMESGVINAINAIVWYNGYYDELRKLKKYISESINSDVDKYSNAPIPDFISDEYDTDHAIRIIWSLMVYMFGSYGGSPRYGWIEKRDDAIAFIDMICKNDEDEGETHEAE